jgi:flavorubredoxin
MHAFLYKLGIKGYQSRRVGVVENGTWAPTAGKTICSMLQQMKNIKIVSSILTIRSAWKEDNQQDLEKLLEGLIREECM